VAKGAWPASRDLHFTFWDPLYISLMDKATDVKFGTENDPKVL